MISHGAKRRLIKKVLSGIQATKDVMFSNINRSLNDQQSLIKTEDRLLRNFDDMDFTEEMNHPIGRLGSSRVHEKMVITYIEVRNEVLLAIPL